MEQCFQEGKWVKAAELADWMRKYFLAREAAGVERGKFRDSHAALVHDAGTKELAKIAELHGYIDETIEFYLENLHDYPASGYWNYHRTNMRYADVLTSHGRGDREELEGILRLMESSFQALLTNKYAGRWLAPESLRTRVKILYALDRKEDVPPLLMQLEKEFSWNHADNLWLRLWMAERDSRSDPELEEVFFELLEHCRETGSKVSEPKLYTLYASYLSRANRPADAVRVQREALRLYESMNFPARDLEARVFLATYLEAAGSPAQAMEIRRDLADRVENDALPLPGAIAKSVARAVHQNGSVAVENPSRRVDLQPLESFSVVAPGGAAASRFTLSNLSEGVAEGKLLLQGAITKMGKGDAIESLHVEVGPEGKDRTLEESLRLRSHQQYPIYLKTTALNAVFADAIKLRWIPDDGQPGTMVTWRYETGREPRAFSISNASLVQRNPFYMVPLYHSMHRNLLQGDSPDLVDFRIRSATPVRIEVYAEESGELLYIDSNGNGILSDPGDLLASDTNGNGYPDLSFPAGMTQRGLEILFQSGDSLSTEELRISCEIRDLNGWIVEAENIVLPSED